MKTRGSAPLLRKLHWSLWSLYRSTHHSKMQKICHRITAEPADSFAWEDRRCWESKKLHARLAQHSKSHFDVPWNLLSSPVCRATSLWDPSGLPLMNAQKIDRVSPWAISRISLAEWRVSRRSISFCNRAATSSTLSPPATTMWVDFTQQGPPRTKLTPQWAWKVLPHCI